MLPSNLKNYNKSTKIKNSQVSIISHIGPSDNLDYCAILCIY